MFDTIEIPSDTKAPEGLLRPDGIMELKTAAQLDAYPWESLRMWCHINTRYGLVTAELIDWLRERIGGRKAIEIGSGHGDFAHHLGITGTDNFSQNLAFSKQVYAAMADQPTMKYAPWVEKLDAIHAIEQHKPEVVFASWVTHWIDPSKKPPKDGGKMYGVKEHILIRRKVTYIMLGNLHTHRNKPILKEKHEEVTLPFLRSRAMYPHLDRLFIWNG